MSSNGERDIHVDGEQIAAYLDRKLAAVERSEIEVHLADCTECRTELLSVTRILQTRRLKRRLYTMGSLAAAAVLAGLLLFAPDGTRNATVEDTRRAADVGTEGIQQIDILTPSQGMTVRRADLSFGWLSVGEDVLYSLAVLDTAGNEVWTGNTTDSILLLPGAVALAQGVNYFWYVDALLPDGRSATTGIHQCRIAP